MTTFCRLSVISDIQMRERVEGRWWEIYLMMLLVAKII